MNLLKNSFNWIKGQFVIEEAPENIVPKIKPESTPLAELPNWLNLKEQEYLHSSGLNDQINQYVNGIKDLRWKIEGKMDEWESNFPPIKQLKREEMMRLFGKIRQFAGMITFSEQATIQEVMAVNKQLGPKLDFLIRKMENTTYSREYSLMMGGEEKEIVESVILSPLLTEMAKILKLKDEFGQKVAQSDLEKWADLKESILDIKGMKLTQEELEKGIQSKQEHLKLVEERILEKEQEVDEIQEKFSSPISEEDKSQKKKQDDLLIQKGILEENLNDFFSRIKPAMKQYYLSKPGNKLMVDYFEDPFGAFSKDPNLEILTILLELSVILKTNNLNLGDDEAEEIITELQNAEESLKNYRELYSQIGSELGNKEINTSDHFASMKIGDAQYRLNHFKAQAEKLRQEIEENEQKVQEQLIIQRTEIEKIQQNLKSLVHKEIEIV